MQVVSPELLVVVAVTGGALNVGAICAFWFRVGTNHADVKNALALLAKDNLEIKAEVKENRSDLKAHVDSDQVFFNRQDRFNERAAAKLGIETLR